MPRICLFILMLLCVNAFSQPRTLPAIKITDGIKVDGKLDESAWQQAPVATDFIQSFPNANTPASTKTEVRILYDNTAIYVSAIMYDDPAQIRRQLTARDGEQQTDADYFAVFFDTYHDKQNGFQFLVTSANVQTDARLGPNLGGHGFGAYGDKTWDAVWESKTATTNEGWIVEMKIPYISLRFSKKSIQSWGLQFVRFSRRLNENAFWNAVDPMVNGFVNQFGVYKDLEDIQPPLRLSFSPYVSTGFRSTPETNGYKTEWLRNGGMDVKYGINESFTLDATLIPDFGQVVSDNVVNNLSPFEVRFQENRPFFSEGTEIFNKAGLFYSRRVGAVPPGFYNVRYMASNDPNLEIVKNPSVTQLYNAIKLSGRNKKKLGIGVFNAVTAPAKAILRDKTTLQETRIITSPLTNYNIVVLDQALRGQSYLTFTNTNVLRNGPERDANVSAFDFNLLNKTNTYSVRGTARYSQVFGPNNYDGFASFLRFSKISGKVQYYAQANVESDKYDPNDLGFLLSPNEVSYSGRISYNQFTPKGKFLTYNYSINARYGWLYKPYAFTDLRLSASAFYVFRNFWDMNFTLGTQPRSEHDYFVMRAPGKFVKRPPYSYVAVAGSTDSRKKLFVAMEAVASTFHIPEPHAYSNYFMSMRYRFSNKFTMELSGRREAETDFIVYAGTETNGDPIVAFVDFTDFTSIISGVYNFTPRLNMTLRSRHNWSNVLYDRFANVDNNGGTIPRTFIPNRDENFNFYNLDAFMTWDFRLGSRIILGWKNWLGADEYVNGSNNRHYLRNLRETFRLRHGNEVTFRFIYFLDYNQLKKKK